MEQYISKSALVAEIEKRKKAIVDDNGNLGFKDCQKAFNEIDELKKFVDTLETKEVDLDAELEHYKAIQNIKYEEDINMFEFAKHFFELGISVSNKAQKGEEV